METRATIVVEGRTLTYLRAGSGPPLVLLHGIGGNATQWRHQLAGLSDAYDILAWDAPGYGGSDDPGAGWVLADYADCLAGLLDALGLEQVHLLGQSWGGVLAQEFYRRHGARIRTLSLADTFQAGSQPADERRAALEARLQALETMTPAEMARVRTPALVGRGAGPQALAEIEQMMAEIRPSGYRHAAVVLAEADTRTALVGIAIPCLVIAGEHDRIVPRALSAELHAAIPGAQWALISGAGHLSGQERPDAFNAVVREFLAHPSG